METFAKNFGMAIARFGRKHGELSESYIGRWTEWMSEVPFTNGGKKDLRVYFDKCAQELKIPLPDYPFQFTKEELRSFKLIMLREYFKEIL